MRNAIVPLIAGILLALTSPALPQSIVENPAKPDNPRAGRVITLEEVMRIEDTGKDFYIRAAHLNAGEILGRRHPSSQQVRDILVLEGP